MLGEITLRYESYDSIDKMSEADRELVVNLLGLESQLLLVGQILPLASAANPEVRAERLLAQR